MNTIIKLEKMLAERGCKLELAPPAPSNCLGWAAVVSTKDGRRGTAGGAHADVAIALALKTLDATTRTGAVEELSDALATAAHPDLPSHESCGLRQCSSCRTALTEQPSDAAREGWIRCVRHLCPSCVAIEQEAARGEKHTLDHYMDLDYPITIYEDPNESDNAFVSECKDLPGAVGWGESPDAAYRMGKEAVEHWLETAFSFSARIPLPSPAPED